MSELKSRIQSDMKEAMKAKDSGRLQSLRLLWNSIRKKEIDDQVELDDQAVQKLLLTMQKQVRESLEQAQSAGRDDLAQEALAEIEVFKSYLPQQLSEDELNSRVAAIKEKLQTAGELPEGGKAMGAMMKAAMAELGVQAEGKLLQGAVKKALGI